MTKNATKGAARVRQGRKFAQVLEGAREVFLASGFEGASVDEIARVAGVSKATLYSYFPDKRLLFLEVIRMECARQTDEAVTLIDLSAPVRVVLRAGARHIIGFVTSDFGRGVHRMCVAEADRFPDLGRQFYESGPEMGRARIVDFLRDACARGTLRIDDHALAADQFMQLCQAHIFDRVACGVQTAFSEAEVNRVIDGAVEMFMARYGVAESSAPAGG
ncbi:TetR/AcrR family transcriptional regulator [Roseicitreum antarcticum]|uniref:Transcriptional regulator, TetR family n=1 Tax=Roseicitreum antarcticum TaxID=564137 RepID=A0A1H2R4U8_9RHOB|nr:TetR/AcrR family transcriptional regulator [Roseicitreum antarcticum]SDW14371.1 transcriptional regulator, TetR family [Roseicitreum antarcticum]